VMNAQEKRTATILFTDLVGSTGLLSRLGEVPYEQIRRAHFITLGRAIKEAGGQQVKGTGDGVLAVFGSADSAVRCAVAIQQAVDRQARSGGPPAVRVGLSLGDVSFEEGDVYGTAVVEAARLVAAAQGGQILASAVVGTVARDRADAKFADVGCLDLRGLPEPVAACEVRWEPLPSSPAPLPALLSRPGRIFVGRDEEMAHLEKSWNDAIGGDLRGALIAGEPGVGKTRLAAELAARVHAEGAVVLAGRCDEDLGVPYQPIVEALRHFVEHLSGEDPVRHLGRYVGELTRLLPELSERFPGLPPPLRSDPETERFRLFDAVAAWLTAASAQQPILLLLDDLQWAAKPTLLLFRHILRSPASMRLLAVVTYRDTEVGRTHPLSELLADLRQLDRVSRLSLSGLDQPAVVAYLELVAGHDVGTEGAGLADAVHRETEGNAFFVREVVRHLIEAGVVRQDGERWTTVLPIDKLGIPEGVRDVLGRRLSRLSRAANEILAVAAVAGQEFELAVVERASGLDEEKLLAALEEAVEARLVTEIYGRAPHYRFAHALVRTTLYEELTVARRAIVHRRVADAIEEVHAGRLEDHLTALAHHFARASAPHSATDKAVLYASRAGDRALAQLANDEAAQYYVQALDLLDVHGACHDDPRRIELLISLGEAQRRAGNPAHRRSLLDAAHLAQARGHPQALVKAALANSRGGLASSVGLMDAERVAVLEAALAQTDQRDAGTRARLLANLSVEVTWDPDRDQAALSDEALALARGVGDVATLAHVLRSRWYTRTTFETRAQLWVEAAEFLAVAERLGDPAMLWEAYAFRVRTGLERGDIEEAERCLSSAEQLAVETDQPTLRWITMWLRGGRFLMSGRMAEAEPVFRHALDLGRALGQADAPFYFAFQLLCVRFEQGRLNEVERFFTEAVASISRWATIRALHAFIGAELGEEDKARVELEHFIASGFEGLPKDPTRLRAMTALAMVATHLQDVQSAKILHGLLAPYADVLDVIAGTFMGAVTHTLGLLDTTLGRFNEGEARFAAASATHLRIGAPTWDARTRLEWASLLITRGDAADAERACELLGQAQATAQQLGLRTVERRAATLLEQVRPARSTLPGAG
jgi:class 3 adenylate cyclase